MRLNRALCSVLLVLVAIVAAGQSTPPTTAPATEESGDPYTLTTCPVSGQPLGAMGPGVSRIIDGRELRFCCGMCPARYEAEKEKFEKKIDEAMIKDQMPYYPVEVCVVMDEPLVDEGEDISVNRIYRNRLVRFCCKGCVRKFNKEPDKFIATLDKAIIAKQRTSYPMKTCLVSGEELGSMGEPVEIVVANRLVRLCCKGCTPAFRKEPAGYLAKLDAAHKKEKATERRSD